MSIDRISKNINLIPKNETMVSITYNIKYGIINKKIIIKYLQMNNLSEIIFYLNNKMSSLEKLDFITRISMIVTKINPSQGINNFINIHLRFNNS